MRALAKLSEAEVAEEERWPKSTAAWPESEWRDDAERICVVRDYVVLHPPTGEKEWWAQVSSSSSSRVALRACVSV